MRILVTGADGQLARCLVERAPVCAVEVVRIGRPDLDVRRPDSIAAALRAAPFDAVVNAAAYTAVDQAEREPELAMAVNAQGAGNVAAAAAAMGLPIVQISTDYVFDGSKPSAYVETNAIAPINVYGRSKAAGEAAVAAANPRHAVLRTAWVYSPFGQNFVTTMLRVAAAQDEVAVVADQTGQPTSALDLADAVLGVARRLALRPGPDHVGIFHATAAGSATWADFAEAVFAASAAAGAASARVRRIGAAELSRPARRPANSVLDTRKLATVYGIALPPWRPSLRACVARLSQLPE